jgi:hypothetical protein
LRECGLNTLFFIEKTRCSRGLIFGHPVFEELSMARRTKRKAKARRDEDVVGKRLQFDRETWNAVDLLARDQMKSVEEIAEEAFRDLLKKHGRSADFREQLRLSARAANSNTKSKSSRK